VGGGKVLDQERHVQVLQGALVALAANRKLVAAGGGVLEHLARNPVTRDASQCDVTRV